MSDDLALAEELAREAGRLILAGELERDGARPDVAATKSSPTDVVTAMDRAVEDLLRRRLAELRPDDAVLGEEAGLEPGAGAAGNGRTWVLDPIDGTVNYLYRIPVYAVSVALVSGNPAVPGGWQPLAGCVHQPPTGRTWTAAQGAGAWLEGRRLRVAPPPALGQALVATGFGYQPQRRAGQARVLSGLLPQIRDIRRIGCASLDLCAVATGTADAYYERGANVWDIAAAALVVTEAGGRIGGLPGGPAGPDLTVAAAPPLFDQLGELLAELGADRD